MNSPSSATRILFTLLAVLAFPLVAPAQTDADKRWTTVGSDGSLDESSVGKVAFDKSKVQMGQVLSNQQSAAQQGAILQQTQSAVIRYNVTPVDGLFSLRPPACTPQPGTSCPAFKLTVRYLDAGANAQVVADLVEVDLATGVETRRMTFDSNKPPLAASNNYQVQSVLSCGPGFFFDFKRKGYYIDATLTRSSIVVGSAAGIQLIKIETGTCLG